MHMQCLYAESVTYPNFLASSRQKTMPRTVSVDLGRSNVSKKNQQVTGAPWVFEVLIS